MSKILVYGLLIFMASASYALCDHVYIQDISEDGSVITATSGKVWVSDQGAVGWDVNDEVLMCNGDNIMINKDQNEQAYVRRVQ